MLVALDKSAPIRLWRIEKPAANRISAFLHIRKSETAQQMKGTSIYTARTTHKTSLRDIGMQEPCRVKWAYPLARRPCQNGMLNQMRHARAPTRSHPPPSKPRFQKPEHLPSLRPRSSPQSGALNFPVKPHGSQKQSHAGLVLGSLLRWFRFYLLNHLNCKISQCEHQPSYEGTTNFIWAPDSWLWCLWGRLASRRGL